MADTDHWAVTVSRNGEQLVTIESNCLSGKADFTLEDRNTIRRAADHLKSFIGTEVPTHCHICGQENTPFAACAVGGCPIGGDL